MRLLLLIAVLVALAVTNPGYDRFEDFVREHAGDAIRVEAEDLPFGDVLGDLGGGLAGRAVRQLSHRDNYVAFSVYTLDLDGRAEEGEEWRFVGVANTFFEWSRPESLAE